MAVKSNVSVQIGLISTIVSLDSGVDKPASISTLCVGQPEHPDHEATPVKAPSQCPTCGPITDYTRTLKGRKSGGGYAILTPEEVAETKMKHVEDCDKVVSLVPHPREDVEALTNTGGKLYYLRPTQNRGGYNLLCALVDAHPELAFAGMFAPRTAPALFVARVGHDANGEPVLIMSERILAANIRALPDMSTCIAATDKEVRDYDKQLGFAEQIVMGSIESFEASTYVDASSDLDAQFAAAKVVDTSTPATAEGDDLTSKLQAQLAAINEGATKDITAAPTKRAPRKTTKTEVAA